MRRRLPTEPSTKPGLEMSQSRDTLSVTTHMTLAMVKNLSQHPMDMDTDMDTMVAADTTLKMVMLPSTLPMTLTPTKSPTT